jgi:hypothetical protein
MGLLFPKPGSLERLRQPDLDDIRVPHLRENSRRATLGVTSVWESRRIAMIFFTLAAAEGFRPVIAVLRDD